ncbi:MAG TPA: hypothetical protein VJ739_09550 [Gemmataceae bacterium]|nr:hypothetical protein [Gemmataceae bacterium]
MAGGIDDAMRDGFTLKNGSEIGLGTTEVVAGLGIIKGIRGAGPLAIAAGVVDGAVQTGKTYQEYGAGPAVEKGLGTASDILANVATVGLAGESASKSMELHKERVMDATIFVMVATSGKASASDLGGALEKMAQREWSRKVEELKATTPGSIVVNGVSIRRDLAESRRAYQEEDKRFQADLVEFPSITAVKDDPAVLKRVERLARAEGLNYNDTYSREELDRMNKEGTSGLVRQPLLDKNGHLDFSHPDAARLLHRAIREEVAEKDDTINNLGSYLPRYNPFSKRETVDAYNKARTDRALLTAAGDELGGYIPIARERAQKRRAYDQKMQALTRTLGQETDALAKQTEAVALDARERSADAEGLADEMKRKLGVETGTVFLQKVKMVDGKPAADGKPVPAATELEAMQAAVGKKEAVHRDLLDLSLKDPGNEDLWAASSSSLKELQEVQLQKEQLGLRIAAMRIEQSKVALAAYHRETVGMIEPAKWQGFKQARDRDPAVQEAVERYAASAKANQKHPGEYHAQQMRLAEVDVLKAERDFIIRHPEWKKQEGKAIAAQAKNETPEQKPGSGRKPAGPVAKLSEKDQKAVARIAEQGKLPFVAVETHTAAPPTPSGTKVPGKGASPA